MKAKKVRRRLIERRIRGFVDVAQYITDRPLLLWAPGIEKHARDLVKAVKKINERLSADHKKAQQDRG
jgi:hypothetical protein